MNFALYIAKRISLKSKRTFSKMIVRIAITGIALGLSVMIVAVSIVSGFKKAIKEKITGFAGDIQITHVDLDKTPQQEAFFKDPALLSYLDTLSEVSHYQEFATKVAIVKFKNQIEPIVLKGVGKDVNWSFYKDKILAGKWFNPADSSTYNQVLVSTYIAKRLGLKTGDEFLTYFAERDLRVRKLKVCGIYEIGVEELDKGFMICHLELIRKLNNWETNQTGGYEVFLKNPAKMEEVTNTVHEQIGMFSKARSARELYPQLFDWVELLDVNGNVIIILMLVVAGINMISALLIMILERTNMIGLLKALGAKNASIRKIFLYNAFYLILVGMCIGNVVGIGVCLLQNHFQFLKLDQQSYYISYVPVDLSWTMVLALNLGTIISCFTMIIIPSLLVTRITPLKAIRFK